ncbi:MAG: trypsin-like peptidase domain-containing protein [Methylocella sp.]
MRVIGILQGLALLVCTGTLPAFSRQDVPRHTLEQCWKAKQATDKIQYCSVVVLHSSNPRALERAFNRRGLAYMEVNRFADAASDFTAVIRLNPKIAGYYDNRQNALKALGQLDEALNDTNTAVQLAPNYSFVYRSRGNVYDAMGRYDLAVANYDAALRIDPNDVGLHFDRGIILVKAGRIKEAIADFSRAFDMDRTMIAALRERGLAYKLLGDYEAATADLTLFLGLEPGDQEVIRALQEMQAAGAPPKVTAPPSRPPPEANKSEAKKSGSLGTGFFVSPEGHIITNAHVVEGCDAPQVASGLSPTVSARVLTRDLANDLALLKSERRSNALASLRAGVRVGEDIEAFGYPLFGLLTTGGNFTVGNVSAIAGLGDDTRYLQISAPIQPGNSGGPVLDQSGNVVGMVVSKLDVVKVFKATDDVAQNVNFAIKATILSNFLDASGVTYVTGTVGQPLQRADLAEHAKSIAVLIRCAR